MREEAAGGVPIPHDGCDQAFGHLANSAIVGVRDVEVAGEVQGNSAWGLELSVDGQAVVATVASGSVIDDRIAELANAGELGLDELAGRFVLWLDRKSTRLNSSHR